MINHTKVLDANYEDPASLLIGMVFLIYFVVSFFLADALSIRVGLQTEVSSLWDRTAQELKFQYDKSDPLLLRGTYEDLSVEIEVFRTHKIVGKIPFEKGVPAFVLHNRTGAESSWPSYPLGEAQFDKIFALHGLEQGADPTAFFTPSVRRSLLDLVALEPCALHLSHEGLTCTYKALGKQSSQDVQTHQKLTAIVHSMSQTTHKLYARILELDPQWARHWRQEPFKQVYRPQREENGETHTVPQTANKK